jgi:regulator of protease activity HflC (stomatin/prohibitin superfamily)
MRTVSFDVATQEVLTRDSVTVSVDAVVYYRVFNPAVSVANVENAQESTRLLAQTTLRNVLGQKTLSEILSDRDQVSIAMKGKNKTTTILVQIINIKLSKILIESLEIATDPWVFVINYLFIEKKTKTFNFLNLKGN